MKAMSLRMRMQTLSPCLTPSRCNPLAIRAARSATSAWSRRRSPLMTPRNGTGKGSDIGKFRRPLIDIGAHGFQLVSAAHQLHLLGGFGQQCRAGIDREIVEHALGGADRIRALAGDLARQFEGGGGDR